MKILALSLSGLLCTASWCPRNPELKLPPDQQALLDLAGGVPPEFAADALLQLVESGKITEHEAKGELIERAFRLASSANFRMPFRAAAKISRDSEPGMLDAAYNLKLDSLSLESRAVKAMMPVDKNKARDLFQQIPRPSLPALTCDDPLVPDVSAYYDAVATIANGAFRPEERKKDEHINFLLDYLSGLASPLQLAPAARTIQSVELNADQRAVLLNKIAGAMESMDGDERSFGAARPMLEVIVTPEMRPSLEKLVARHKSSTPCETGIQVAAAIGRAVAVPAPSIRIDPAQALWQSADSKQILEQAMKLRFRSPDHMLSPAERSTTEWQQQLTDFLSQMAGWKPGPDEPAEAYFHERTIIYEGLVELIPPGPDRDRVFTEFIGFLSASSLARQKPAEWFLPARDLYERMSTNYGGEPAKILDAFRNSGNSVLALFAAEQKAFPSKPTAGQNRS